MSPVEPKDQKQDVASNQSSDADDRLSDLLGSGLLCGRLVVVMAGLH
jgi:hypothetical protein